MKNIIITFVLALGLVGCGSSGGGGTTGGTTTPPTTPPTTSASDFTQFFDSVFNAAPNSVPVDINNANLVDNDMNNPAAYNSRYGL